MEKVVEFLSSKDVNAHRSTPGLKVDFKVKAFYYIGGDTFTRE